MINESLMRLALAQAVKAKEGGELPYGAVLSNGRGEILLGGYQTLRTNLDATRHPEIELVRSACRKHGPDLTGWTLVCTVEPCPMCFGAAWFAKVSKLVFGVTMSEVANLTEGAIRQLRVPVGRLNSVSGAPLALVRGVMAADCLALFKK